MDLVPPLTGAPSTGNLEQTIFDAFPPYPAMVTLDSLVAVLPFDRRSIIKALCRLRDRRVVEKPARNGLAVYRLCKNARRPIDMRGQHGNAGRPPRAA